MTPYEQRRQQVQKIVAYCAGCVAGAAALFIVLSSTGHICPTGSCVDVPAPTYQLGDPTTVPVSQ